jgi:hypothetical protein
MYGRDSDVRTTYRYWRVLYTTSTWRRGDMYDEHSTKGRFRTPFLPSKRTSERGSK